MKKLEYEKILELIYIVSSVYNYNIYNNNNNNINSNLKFIF